MNDTDEFSFVLKPSIIAGAGVGIFATHNIVSGTELALMPRGGESNLRKKEEVDKEFLDFCIVRSDGLLSCPKEFNHMWIVWYLNHSNTPNIVLNKQEHVYYALRDIPKGEELLTDYNQFDEPKEARDPYYRN